MVMWSINNALGGEIFVPKIPSYNILTLADSIKRHYQKDYRTKAGGKNS